MIELFSLVNFPLLLFSIAVVLAAAVVRGYIGFGFSALCVVSLSFFLPMSDLVPVVLMLEVCASVFLIGEIWRSIRWRFVFGLTLSSVLAAPLGVAALLVLPALAVKVFVHCLIALACVALSRGLTLKSRQAPWQIVLVGLFAGAVNAAGAVGGLIYSVFLIADGMPPAQFRASLAMIFLTVDLLASVLLAHSGLLQPAHGQWLLVLLPPLAIGLFFGSRLFAQVSKQTFKQLVIRLLMVLVVFGLFSTFMPWVVS